VKCQQCEKQAVFHITELESGDVREVHLCEDHARTYLNPDELSLLDKKACPMCGISFFEFRNQGRLGCAHDYVHFEKELEPLISNIHGSTQHCGRRPVRDAGREPPLPEATDDLTVVIGLRRSMQEAIACEDYEKAREDRDAIRGIEERWLGEPRRDAAPGKTDGATDET